MRLTLVQVRKFVFLAIVVVFVGGLGYRLGEKSTKYALNGETRQITARGIQNRDVPLDKKIDFALFWEVWDKLESTYLNRQSLDTKKMVYGAISGMVASAGDPYTVFLPPGENTDAKSDLRGDFEGVGIQIGYNKDQKVTVIAPLSGTPAEKAGIMANDVIVKIIDEANMVDRDTAGLALPEAVKLIRGEKGTVVKLTLAREGKEPFEVTLKRETIVVKSVELSFSETANKKMVANLKLSRFGERTDQEWQEAVAEITTQMKKGSFAGVVLDVRNNPGGLLQGSVFIASEFLKDGTVVTQDRGNNNKESYPVNRKGSLINVPLVVLTNGGSASAAEIVAGVLQERARAKIVGEKTFGKGTVQEAQDIESGSGLHITVARWLLPSGKSIDKDGVKPDFEVKPDLADLTNDTQLKRAIEVLVTGK